MTSLSSLMLSWSFENHAQHKEHNSTRFQTKWLKNPTLCNGIAGPRRVPPLLFPSPSTHWIKMLRCNVSLIHWVNQENIMRFKYFHFIFDTNAEKAHAWLCLTLRRYLDTTYRVDYDSPYPYQTQKVTFFTRCDKHDVFEMHACYIITPKYFACNNVRAD